MRIYFNEDIETEEASDEVIVKSSNKSKKSKSSESLDRPKAE